MAPESVIIRQKDCHARSSAKSPEGGTTNFIISINEDHIRNQLMKSLLFLLSVTLFSSQAVYAANAAIAGGSNHTVALRDDGTVWAWGNNEYGQLGDGTITDSKKPVQVAGMHDGTFLADIKAIACGANHTIVLAYDGTVLTCGRNFHGQLGNGTATNMSRTPVQVTGITDVRAIAGRGSHTVALRNDGTVWTWGWNFHGQLGNGTNTDSPVPVQVLGLENVKAVASGERFSIALKNDGTVWGWGHNSDGQIGNKTGTDSNIPVPVPELNDITAIAGGGDHAIALEDDGTVWTWGDNTYGQLGNGINIDEPTETDRPVRVTDLNHVISVAGGEMHTIALRDDGTVWAWGNNDYGQLGDGTLTDSSRPVSVSSAFNLKNVISVAGGGSHTIALKNNGELWAWGRNEHYQLGEGMNIQENTPVQAYHLSYDISSAAGGGFHTIALEQPGGKVWTWGSNTHGQLGDGTNTDRSIPAPVSSLEGITFIAGGERHSIAVREDGTVWAYGDNTYGQLGDGTNTHRNTPVQIPGLENIRSAACGSDHSIALGEYGSVWAWGSNFHGQLGDGTNTDSNKPKKVPDIATAVSVACGANHTMALRKNGTLRAWGSNFHGQLGDEGNTDRNEPIQPADLQDIIAIACGANHSLAVRADRTVWAWGDNAHGQLGDGTTMDRNDPVMMLHTEDAQAAAGGVSHTIILNRNGTMRAYGDNEFGQLCRNYDHSGVIQVCSFDNVKTIASGSYHTIAVREGNTAIREVLTWGDNRYGQLGHGTEPWLLVQADIELIGLPSAIIALRIVSGMTPRTFVNDVSADKKIGLEEAVHFLQLAAGLKP